METGFPQSGRKRRVYKSSFSYYMWKSYTHEELKGLYFYSHFCLFPFSKLDKASYRLRAKSNNNLLEFLSKNNCSDGVFFNKVAHLKYSVTGVFLRIRKQKFSATT